MEDVGAQIDQAGYTQREKELADWFKVKPDLIRTLTELAETIRETNVTDPAVVQTYRQP